MTLSVIEYRQKIVGWIITLGAVALFDRPLYLINFRIEFRPFNSSAIEEVV